MALLFGRSHGRYDALCSSDKLSLFRVNIIYCKLDPIDQIGKYPFGDFLRTIVTTIVLSNRSNSRLSRNQQDLMTFLNPNLRLTTPPRSSWGEQQSEHSFSKHNSWIQLHLWVNGLALSPAGRWTHPTQSVKESKGGLESIVCHITLLCMVQLK